MPELPRTEEQWVFKRTAGHPGWCLRSRGGQSSAGAGQIFPFLSMGARASILFLPRCPDTSEENAAPRRRSRTFLRSGPNGFRDTIEGDRPLPAPARRGRIFIARAMTPLPGQRAHRMHCPHKSVNQTSLTRCYWCSAATGAAVLPVANRPRYSRLPFPDESRHAAGTRISPAISIVPGGGSARSAFPVTQGRHERIVRNVRAYTGPRPATIQLDLSRYTFALLARAAW